ncbi:hypothetical protein J6590_028346 [Homalodisca vitripennis]|nr:hypothetical protein J6590_028346 [Homalodisca vitripennis]
MLVIRLSKQRSVGLGKFYWSRKSIIGRSHVCFPLEATAETVTVALIIDADVKRSVVPDADVRGVSFSISFTGTVDLLLVEFVFVSHQM